MRFSEAWDACGLQVGDPDAGVERLLVALDPNSITLKEAEDLHCQCLLTHHPLVFKPLPAVRSDQYPGKLVIAAIQKGIHLIAAHTNLDVARDGTNDRLASMLALISIEPLEVASHLVGEPGYAGLGCLGELSLELPLKEFAALVRDTLDSSSLRIVGDLDKPVRKVALCTGSGGSLMEQVIAGNVDVYVTGDVKFHEAQRAREAGLAVVDVGHFASEHIIVKPLADFMNLQAVNHGKVLTVLTAQGERDPFVPY